jgi:hypothetical protein
MWIVVLPPAVNPVAVNKIYHLREKRLRQTQPFDVITQIDLRNLTPNALEIYKLRVEIVLHI